MVWQYSGWHFHRLLLQEAGRLVLLQPELAHAVVLENSENETGQKADVDALDCAVLFKRKPSKTLDE
jgi:hypothetical protein